ncbi:hypothetical protein LTR08_007304 [Meristemomyces frigidus]|nr:hypothetical protein LTR08_007304 [Meristemomyces frigidus]
MALPITSKTPFDIGLGLEGTHVLVTGGCGLIGRVVVHAFLAAGCLVTIVDILDPSAAAVIFELDDRIGCYLQGSIANHAEVECAFGKAEKAFGPVHCCIALAGLDLSVLKPSESICDVDPEEWRRVFDVNINGTFLTCQRWLRGIRAANNDPYAAVLRNVSLVIMGSEAGAFGVRTMAAYAAGKSAVQYGLLLSLAKDVPRIYSNARVNAVAPGAVDTDRFKDESKQYGAQWRYEECEATVGLAKPVPPEHVARTILFLASERFSGSVHGQCIAVDSGKMGSVVWGKDELAERRRGGPGM